MNREIFRDIKTCSGRKRIKREIHRRNRKVRATNINPGRDIMRQWAAARRRINLKRKIMMSGHDGILTFLQNGQPRQRLCHENTMRGSTISTGGDVGSGHHTIVQEMHAVRRMT